MQAKLTQAKVHWDSWFTGVDFPDAALRAISSAARRRKLGGLLKYFLVLLCILKFDILSFKLYHVHKPTDILGMEASQHSSLAGRVTYPLHPGSCKSASFIFFTFGLFPQKKLGLKQLQEQSLLPCEVYQEELPRPLHVQRHDELCERPRCQEAETGFLDSTGFFGFVFFGGALHCLYFSDEAGSVQCLTHKQKCPRKVYPAGDVTRAGVEGPPCVLFSTSLGC